MSNNRYEDYLPQNRFAKEGGFSPKLARVFLLMFVAFLVVAVIYFHNKSQDGFSFRGENRFYHLNLSESIELGTINSDSDIIWESNSDCVMIENGIVTAVSPGMAYIIGKKKFGNIERQVTDLTIKVLDGKEDLTLENHSVVISVGEKQKIVVNQDNNSNDNYQQQVKEKVIVPRDSMEQNTINGVSLKELLESMENLPDDGGDGFIDVDTSDDDSSVGDPIISDDKKDDVTTVDNPEFNLRYESSDPSVAVVDDKGNVTSVSEGIAVITVTDSLGNEDHSYVVVKEDDISISVSEYNLKVGESKKIDYKLSSKYKESDVVIQSDNACVDVIDGMIRGVSRGEAMVSLKVSDTVVKVKVVVTENIILPTSIELSSDNITLFAGDVVKVDASVIPSNSTSKGISWKSSNNSVCVVDQFGNIKGINAGSAVVSVTTSNGISKNIQVKVNKKIIEAVDIRFEQSNINMKVGDTVKISYVISPSATTDKSVTFSYDKKYVSLDSNGNLHASSAGTTQVTVTTANGHSASLQVTISSPVIRVSEIRINEGNLKLTQGGSKKLSVTTNPSSVDKSKMTWSSSDNNVASISSDGTVVAKSVGTAKITVTLDGKSSSVVVEVSKKVIPVSKIILNKTKIEMTVGKTYSDLMVKVEPSDATNKNVVWSSSNPKVAVVDNQGKVTAVGKGEAVITAKSSDNGSVFGSCTVVVSYKVSLSLNCGTQMVVVGNSLTAKATVSPSSANQGVSWSSSNTKIATVSNGKIVGKAIGTANITATSLEDKTKSQTCKITVKRKYTVILNPSHQVYNTTVSSNKAKYGTEMKSMYVLGRILEKKLKNAGYNVILTPDSGSINGNDRCWEIDNWSLCGRKYVNWAVNKGGANKSADNVYIALHSNATGTSTRLTGPMVFSPYRYTSNKSIDFSKMLCKSILSVYQNYHFSSNFTVDSCPNRWQRVGEPSMYYDAGGLGASVLIEIGFHDHSGNQQFIENRGNELSDAIVKAVDSYASKY